MNCLVLNSLHMPIDICSPKKAMTKLAKEKATLVETYVDDYLDDWRKAMEAPAVIRLAHFMFPPAKKRFERFTRKNIWLRDRGHCQYCNAFIPLNKMHWDHVIPRDKGGKTNWQNIVCACLKCNQKKANTVMKPLKKPVAMLRKISIEKEMILRLKSLKDLPSDKWRQYIYWNVELEET